MKKKDIKKTINRIKITIYEIEFFDNLITSFFIYFLLLLFSSLLNLGHMIPLYLAIIYFLIKFYKLFNKKILIKIEEKYPKLKERLRTVADNLKNENLMVKELKKEVANDLKIIDFKRFFDINRFLVKIVASIILSLLILFLIPHKIDLSSYKNYLKEKILDVEEIPLYIYGPGGKEGNLKGQGSGNIPSEEANENGGVSGAEALYGEKKIIKLSDESFEVKIKPLNFELDLSDFKEGGGDNIKETNSFYNVELLTSSTYEEKIPIEKKELVKNYFEKKNK